VVSSVVLSAEPRSRLKQSGQQPGSLPIGEEAEVADADEASWEQMQEEAAEELIDRQAHEALPVAVCGVSPAEADLPVRQGDQPAVGDTDAMGVGAEYRSEADSKGCRRTDRGIGGLVRHVPSSSLASKSQTDEIQLMSTNAVARAKSVHALNACDLLGRGAIVRDRGSAPDL